MNDNNGTNSTNRTERIERAPAEWQSLDRWEDEGGRLLVRSVRDTNELRVLGSTEGSHDGGAP